MEENISMQDIFTVRYQARGIVHDTHFQAPDLASAIQLAQTFCNVYRYKFIFAQPFCTDLQKLIDKAHASA